MVNIKHGDSLKQNSFRLGSAGFGLVELMVALALGTVLLLGITQLFSSGSRSLGDVSAAGRNIENASYAIDVISSDLRLVGYWGEVLGLEMTPDILSTGEVPSGFPPALKFPGPCLGTGANFDSGTFSPRVELAWGMEFPLFASRSDYTNYGSVIPCGVENGAAPASDSEFVVVRRASTCSAQDAACAAPDATARFYVQSNGCYDPTGTGLVGGETQLQSVTSSDINDSGKLDYLQYNVNGCTTTAMGWAYAPSYRYVAHTYFVSDDVLYRLVFNGATFEQQALIDGIESMRFEWGRDTDGDGSVDVFNTTLEASTAEWLEEWKDVVAVKIWLLVRGDESIAGFSDPNSYSLAGGVAYTPPEALKKYPRRLVTRLIELPNIAGPRR